MKKHYYLSHIKHVFTIFSNIETANRGHPQKQVQQILILYCHD